MDKNSDLLTENLGLKRKLMDMESAHAQTITALQEKHRKEIAAMAASNPKPADFVEKMGVLWKRSGNGFEKTPYCPQCSNHPLMFGQPPMGGDPMLWQCSKCGFTADFAGRPKA